MRKRHRHLQPGRVLRLAWQQLHAYGCILCRQPAVVGAVFLPSDPRVWGALAGGRKGCAYLLCQRCYDRPVAERNTLVEQHLAADLRRQQAARN